MLPVEFKRFKSLNELEANTEENIKVQKKRRLQLITSHIKTIFPSDDKIFMTAPPLL